MLWTIVRTKVDNRTTVEILYSYGRGGRGIDPVGGTRERAKQDRLAARPKHVGCNKQQDEPAAACGSGLRASWMPGLVNECKRPSFF